MIAYYVHHQGAGHRQRAVAVAARLQSPVVGLSSADAPVGWQGRWLRLPDDAAGVDPSTADVTAGSAFHWLPRRHDGLRRRMGAVSSVLTDSDVRLVVCDVSVEVSVLARLHGVPVVVVAQPGQRTDRAHRLAYDLADRLLAPWPRRPDPSWPAAWMSKTVHVGGISRYDGRPVARPSRPGPGGERRVLVMWGSGGVDVARESVHDAARATPAWTWQLAGPPPRADVGDVPSNVEDLGWVGDMWPLLCRADVVVTHAGQNAVAEVAAAQRPAVVVAQERPFAEQAATAEVLRRAGLATVATGWPNGHEWPGLLDRAAAASGGGWASWSSGDGARQAAEAIDELAGPR